MKTIGRVLSVLAAGLVATFASNPVYDFTTVDRIFDAYLSNNVRPFVQLGFMPEALSTHPKPYRHEWRPGLPYESIMTGWAYWTPREMLKVK